MSACSVAEGGGGGGGGGERRERERESGMCRPGCAGALDKTCGVGDGGWGWVDFGSGEKGWEEGQRQRTIWQRKVILSTQALEALGGRDLELKPKVAEGGGAPPPQIPQRGKDGRAGEGQHTTLWQVKVFAKGDGEGGASRPEFRSQLGFQAKSPIRGGGERARAAPGPRYGGG